MSETRPSSIEFEPQPADSIELYAGPLEARINPHGASVDTLRFHGHDIFFPKQEVIIDGTLQERGGMHVCLPQFGQDSRYGLPEHGFGRDVEWRQTMPDERSLHLYYEDTEGRGAYPPGLATQLTYRMKNTSSGGWVLCAEMNLQNRGKEALPVAPAFHPYFATNGRDFSATQRDERLIDLTDEEGLARTKFSFVERPIISIHNHDTWQASMRTGGLQEFVNWTDDASRYVCVEPSAKGAAFKRQQDYEYIPSGESSRYVFELELKIR